MCSSNYDDFTAGELIVELLLIINLVLFTNAQLYIYYITGFFAESNNGKRHEMKYFQLQ